MGFGLLDAAGVPLKPLALLCLSLCGCGPSTWRVEGEVTPEWSARAVAISEKVREIARPREPWGGVIEVRPAPFPCDRWVGDDKLCAGVNPSGQYVIVAWTNDALDGALAHELAHAAMCRPKGDCGERVAWEIAARVVEELSHAH